MCVYVCVCVCMCVYVWCVCECARARVCVFVCCVRMNKTVIQAMLAVPQCWCLVVFSYPVNSRAVEHGTGM